MTPENMKWIFLLLWFAVIAFIMRPGKRIYPTPLGGDCEYPEDKE